VRPHRLAQGCGPRQGLRHAGDRPAPSAPRPAPGTGAGSTTRTWTRAGTDLKRCDAPAASAAPSAPPADGKPAPAVAEKAEPAPQEKPDAPPPGKPAKAPEIDLAALEKLARDVVKFEQRTVRGKKECQVKMPYIGTVAVPCPE
jgi:hypothetical protein